MICEWCEAQSGMFFGPIGLLGAHHGMSGYKHLRLFLTGIDR